MSLIEVFQSLDMKGLEGDHTVYFIPGFTNMLIELIVGIRENLSFMFRRTASPPLVWESAHW